MAYSNRDRPPTLLLVAVVALVLQAVGYGAASVLTFLESWSKVEHGQSGAAPLALGGGLVLLLALVLAGSAVTTFRKVSWMRWLTVAAEGFLLLSGLLGFVVALIAQDPIGILITVTLLVLAGTVGGLLLSVPARRWFTGT